MDNMRAPQTESQNISIAPGWLAEVEVINPTPSMVADLRFSVYFCDTFGFDLLFDAYTEVKQYD